MIDIRTKDDCTGCGACAEHCPRRCIRLVTDADGWRHPVVNVDLCLNCGLCDNVCPVMVKRAIATGNFFNTACEGDTVEPPREEEPDMRGLLFDIAEYGGRRHAIVPADDSATEFRAGDCVLSLYGPNDKGRLLKVRDGAGYSERKGNKPCRR